MMRQVARVREGAPLPPLRLPRLDGKTFTLDASDRRVMPIFFFCGCDDCYKVATEWCQMQRSGALKESYRIDATVVIYVDLSVVAAKALAEQIGWPGEQSILLLDRDNQVRDLWKAEPCPRVFLRDSAGVLRYTNVHPYDAARKAAPPAIVAFTLDALKKLSPNPTTRRK